ncbi:hypothetical protein [Dokdonella ginsengisoli]|uniref:Glycine zipper 2TM domain-containing protein n=1 Tax=Dokdonella ginsengisoli TaxID=363846 RepID=A0ABV9QQM5_9GAMM
MSTLSPSAAVSVAPPRPLRRAGALLLAVLFALLMADGAVARDNKKRNTLIGVGLGAVGGALLTNGDVWGTVGGAAAGGVIGNVLTKDRHDRRWDRRDYYDRRDRRDYYDRRDRHHHRR